MAPTLFPQEEITGQSIPADRTFLRGVSNRELATRPREVVATHGAAVNRAAKGPPDRLIRHQAYLLAPQPRTIRLRRPIADEVVEAKIEAAAGRAAGDINDKIG